MNKWNGWIIEWMRKWMNEWNEWRNNWMNKEVNGWMEWMNGWMNKEVNEWMIQWMSEWRNDWMRPWVNEAIIECINTWHFSDSLAFVWNSEKRFSERLANTLPSGLPQTYPRHAKHYSIVMFWNCSPALGNVLKVN